MAEGLDEELNQLTDQSQEIADLKNALFRANAEKHRLQDKFRREAANLQRTLEGKFRQQIASLQQQLESILAQRNTADSALAADFRRMKSKASKYKKARSQAQQAAKQL